MRPSASTTSAQATGASSFCSQCVRGTTAPGAGLRPAALATSPGSWVQHYFINAPAQHMPGINAQTAQTDTLGNWSIDVLPGSYRVYAPQVNPYIAPAPVLVTAVALQTTVVTFTSLPAAF